MRRETILVWGGLLVIIVFFGTVYFFVTKKMNVSDAEKISVQSNENGTEEGGESELSDGAIVYELNNNKFLKDERVGYEIQIPKESRIEKKDNELLLYYFDKEDSEFSIVGATITLFDRQGLSLDQWILNIHTEDTFVFYDQKEIINIGSLKMVKIPVDGPGVRYEYFIPIKDGVLKIHSIGDEFFDSAVQKIRIIN